MTTAYKPNPQLLYAAPKGSNGSIYSSASVTGNASTNKHMSLLAATSGGKATNGLKRNNRRKITRRKKIRGGLANLNPEPVTQNQVTQNQVIATPIKPMFAETGPVNASSLALGGQQNAYNQHAASQFDNCANGGCPATVTKVGGKRKSKSKSRTRTRTSKRKSSKKKNAVYCK